MTRTATILLALLASTAMAGASEVDDAVIKFINAPGFEPANLESIENRLDTHWLRTDLISPSGPVGPIEKAVMIASDAIDGTRTRTAISYGQMPMDDAGPFDAVSFVEVRHYNLGQIIREGVMEDYGAENTGGPEDFGLGEHHAWRFVFFPVMGNTAMLHDASSRVIPEDEAATDDCTGRPCLDLGSNLDDLAVWEEISGTLPDWPQLYPEMSDEIATPAHAIAELAVAGFWASAESGDYQWTGGEHPEAARGFSPYRFIGIDRNLGQEVYIDTVWHETLLNDHAISDLYLRRLDIAGWVSFMRDTTER